MAASCQPFGIEVRLAPQLGDPLGRNVGMTLFLVRVLEELLGHCLCMNASGHVVVTFISQYTDNLRRQDLIQDADYRFPVRTVAASDRTHLHRSEHTSELQSRQYLVCRLL